MLYRALSFAIALSMPAGVSWAEFAKIHEQTDFVRAIAGKELSRPWIRLRVTEDGRIEGNGSRWPVTGRWSWRDGYFCRDLYWGGDDLGYNCQEVRIDGARIRFTSDRGEGASAVFRLR